MTNRMMCIIYVLIKFNSNTYNTYVPMTINHCIAQSKLLAFTDIKLFSHTYSQLTVASD